MPSDNSLNTAKGRTFQEQVRKVLDNHFGIGFLTDYPVKIGNPPKEHKFDLVSSDHKYIAECKNFSWTETGKIPDAKMAKCDQALLYLSLVPINTKKLLIMRKDTHLDKRETLAEYYKRTHLHLLADVIIMEFDPLTGKLTQI